MSKTILPLVHTSEETAFLIESYPYGRLRCQKRVWLETNKKGTRVVSRTSNPKRGNDWRNASKAGTYSDSVALYLDEQGHVQCDGISFAYADEDKLKAWVDTYGENATNIETARDFLRRRVIFNEELTKAGNPEYGTTPYSLAYSAAKRRF